MLLVVEYRDEMYGMCDGNSFHPRMADIHQGLQHIHERIDPRLHSRRVPTSKAGSTTFFFRRRRAFDAKYLFVLGDSRLLADAVGTERDLGSSFRTFLLKFVAQT